MRPPYIWNFFGEEEEKIEHLINPKANPEQCYKYEENNRVRRIFDACTDLGVNLSTFEAANWSKLVEHTIQIFDSHWNEYQIEKKKLDNQKM